MDETNISSSELLQLEDKQLYMFLTQIRPIGEEKSDLYPEPQYFNATFMGNAVSLPYVLDKIVKHGGAANVLAARSRRVLSSATALHFSGLAFTITWGREMLLMEDDVPGQRPGVVFDDGDVILTDKDAARCLRFSYDAARHYRRDGLAYPSDTHALGSNYCILTSDETQRIAEHTTSVDHATARDLLGLMAAIRALSFLMEAETREALMVHGPYPTSDPKQQLVIFECNDLQWQLFPNFPLSGGVHWSLPSRPFPTAKLAIALLLQEVDVKADRFGTLYIDPLGPANVVAASLLTRGVDPYSDSGLSEVPISEARSLRRLCDEIQEYMFMQVASWDLRQRMEAGVLQKQTFFARLLAGAGFDRREIEREQEILFDRCGRVFNRQFESILSRSTDQLPFYRKLGDFMSQKIATIFTPLVGTE